MKLLSTYLRGKSLTVCFAFPEDYDMANIDDLNVSIGSKQFTGDDIDISGQVACVRLKSEDTYKFTGDYPIIISIDDKTLGVIPIYVGDIRFVTHRNTLNNASTNEQNDIVIALSITQTTINVDSVLYDVMAGKAATIEVGTVTTLEAGEDATIENTGTENEAVFNFGIPKGEKGDKGDAGTIEVGEVTTGDAGTDVFVENVGTPSEAVLNFTIPRGDAGYTPYIGVNGNWFINGVDTGVQAEGDATEAWVAQNYLSKLDFVGEFEPVRDKLAGIEDNANNYVHPATHPPEIIEQDANNRFVTDAEKSTWNGKQNDLGFTPENAANKQNSLAVDGTGEKYPTVDAVNEGLSDKITEDAIYKVLQIGGSGLVTLKPTTSHFTYRLNVTANMTLNIDLSRMIQQVGSARCRLIIDMPIVRTITITNPVLWGGTTPTFAAAGQYIFEIIDVDGSGTPLIWQVASTTKVEPTGVILYVDSDGADYTVGQINGETATRTTSTWAAPFKYLQNAINAASSGDIIFVKQGVYKPTHLRLSPETYTDGDHLLRDATFTPKNSVDMYGGFLGTESKTWEREVDENGYPVNPTILDGDILNEAEIDPTKTVGDTRTDASKAGAAYNVVMAKDTVSQITYLNGFEVRHGNADGSVDLYNNRGGGINAIGAQLVGINNTVYSNTASYGGGWYYGTNTNCTANNNTGTHGGGWREGTNTNCIANNNTAENGGGWRFGTNTNCTANNNTATNGGGWYSGTNTNCIATNNTATTNGGGWYVGTNVNCTGINNRAPQAVFSSTVTDTNINCLLFNNKNTSNVVVGFDNKTASGVKIFLNNAYDVAHPTITGGAGSEINTATCIQNLTAEQAKIEVPSFVGNATTPEQLAELEQYVKDIPKKLKPKLSSILKGAGVRRSEVSANDFNGDERLDPCTIGAIEGE